MLVFFFTFFFYLAQFDRNIEIRDLQSIKMSVTHYQNETLYNKLFFVCFFLLFFFCAQSRVFYLLTFSRAWCIFRVVKLFLIIAASKHNTLPTTTAFTWHNCLIKVRFIQFHVFTPVMADKRIEEYPLGEIIRAWVLNRIVYNVYTEQSQILQVM